MYNIGVQQAHSGACSKLKKKRKTFSVLVLLALKKMQSYKIQLWSRVLDKAVQYYNNVFN